MWRAVGIGGDGPDGTIDGMIGRRIGRFEIVDRLGEGGMGAVYRARDRHLERDVAVKVLLPEAAGNAEWRRRFMREAKAASGLNHPNIVHVYDVDEADGELFIAMEYIAGKTLDQAIDGKGLPLREALRYAVPLADALAKAHAAGIVHRDLKPSNVMITAERIVKVLDFGLAKLMEPAEGREGGNRPDESRRPDQGRDGGGDGSLHVSGASGRQGGGWEIGHLFIRRRAVRDVDRAAGIRRDDPDGDDFGGAARRAEGAERDLRIGAEGTGAGDRALPAQGSGPAVSAHGGPASRAGGSEGGVGIRKRRHGRTGTGRRESQEVGPWGRLAVLLIARRGGAAQQWRFATCRPQRTGGAWRRSR